MKSLIVLAVCLAAILADDPHGLKSAHEKCHTEHPPPEKPPKADSSGSSSEEHDHHHGPHVEHLKCLAKELGLVDDEGKIKVEGVKLHVGHVETDSAKVDEIVKDCAVEKDSADESVAHVVKCLYKKHVFVGDRDHEHHPKGSHEPDESHHKHHHHHHNHSSEEN